MLEFRERLVFVSWLPKQYAVEAKIWGLPGRSSPWCVPHGNMHALVAGLEWRKQRHSFVWSHPSWEPNASTQELTGTLESLTGHLMFSLGIMKHVTSLCSPKGLFGSPLASHCDVTEGGRTKITRCRERRQQCPNWSNSFIAQYLWTCGSSSLSLHG